MISFIFNDKCAIFLIFIALMCASGFNNWCCRMVASQNYPAKLPCFQPSVVQVVNYKTWVVINLAPSPCSLEMATGNNSKKIQAGKNSSPTLSSSCVHSPRERAARPAESSSRPRWRRGGGTASCPGPAGAGGRLTATVSCLWSGLCHAVVPPEPFYIPAACFECLIVRGKITLRCSRAGGKEQRRLGAP